MARVENSFRARRIFRSVTLAKGSISRIYRSRFLNSRSPFKATLRPVVFGGCLAKKRGLSRVSRASVKAFSMARSVVELMTFLDVCQLYLQTKKKSRNLCTLWAIVTFIRTEDTGDFLRWCRAYTVPRLRYRTDRAKKTENAEKLRPDKLILRLLQELFYCGCLPPCEIGL